MFQKLFRKFSSEPLKFMKKIEKPLVDLYEKATLNYPFKSKNPITKTLINSSIAIYILW